MFVGALSGCKGASRVGYESGSCPQLLGGLVRVRAGGCDFVRRGPMHHALSCSCFWGSVWVAGTAVGMYTGTYQRALAVNARRWVRGVACALAGCCLACKQTCSPGALVEAAAGLCCMLIHYTTP